MLHNKIKYEFSAKVWQHASSGGWHFVSLPTQMANEIRSNLKWQEEGWGRLKVIAQIGNSVWSTAIWFDTKHKTYLLPLKSIIRKNERIELKDYIVIIIWI